MFSKYSINYRSRKTEVVLFFFLRKSMSNAVACRYLEITAGKFRDNSDTRSKKVRVMGNTA